MGNKRTCPSGRIPRCFLWRCTCEPTHMFPYPGSANATDNTANTTVNTSSSVPRNANSLFGTGNTSKCSFTANDVYAVLVLAFLCAAALCAAWRVVRARRGRGGYRAVPQEPPEPQVAKVKEGDAHEGEKMGA